jgi:heptosyltransferase-1
MRVLIVKMSSMGDVVHALPVLSDIELRLPSAHVDWLVEPPFAALPAMHPFVRQVLPVAWRKWRKALARRESWNEMRRLREALRREPYDLVLDLQGLMKSALWGRQARGPLAGYDRDSAREPLATLFYTRRAAVPRTLHAVERCRRLAATHLGYRLPDGAPRFGIKPPAPSWHPPAPYAVLIPGASRKEKLWPEPSWSAIGQRFATLGWTPVVLWGNPSEEAQARRIAAGCSGLLPPFLTVKDMAAVLGGARQVVGLDTGFSHLAAALGRATIGIYCDHDPGLAGITGSGPVASLGGKRQAPDLVDVMRALEQQLAQSAQQE